MAASPRKRKRSVTRSRKPAAGSNWAGTKPSVAPGLGEPVTVDRLAAYDEGFAAGRTFALQQAARDARQAGGLVLGPICDPKALEPDAKPQTEFRMAGGKCGYFVKLDPNLKGDLDGQVTEHMGVVGGLTGGRGFTVGKMAPPPPITRSVTSEGADRPETMTEAACAEQNLRLENQRKWREPPAFLGPYPFLRQLFKLPSNPTEERQAARQLYAKHVTKHHVPDAGGLARIHEVRKATEDFIGVLLRETRPGHDRKAAIFAAREAMMWANASIAVPHVGIPE